MKRKDQDYASKSRDFWRCAGTFSTEKEKVYPQHAIAQQFDQRKEGERVLEYGCGGGSDALSYARRGCYVVFVDIVPENIAKTAVLLRQELVEIAHDGITLNHEGGIIAARANKFEGWVLPSSAEFLREDLSARAVIEDKVVEDINNEVYRRNRAAFDDNVFDVISSHGVLHHIIDPLPVLLEFHRMLKPGGKLYVMLYTEHLWKKNEERAQGFINNHGLSAAEAFGWCTDGEGCPYADFYTEQSGWKLLEAAGFEAVSCLLYNNGDFRTFVAEKAG